MLAYGKIMFCMEFSYKVEQEMYFGFHNYPNTNTDELCRSIKQIISTKYQERPPIDEIMKEFSQNGRICNENNEKNNDENIEGIRKQSHCFKKNNDENIEGIRKQSHCFKKNNDENIEGVRKQFYCFKKNNDENIEGVRKQFYCFKKNNNRNIKDVRKQFCSHKKNKKEKQVKNYCVFCRNNNEPEDVVRSHAVRDSFGRVLCPKLRIYRCPTCGDTGDNAHTIKYCPKKPIITMEDTIKMDFNRKNRCGGKLRV